MCSEYAECRTDVQTQVNCMEPKLDDTMMIITKTTEKENTAQTREEMYQEVVECSMKETVLKADHQNEYTKHKMHNKATQTKRLVDAVVEECDLMADNVTKSTQTEKTMNSNSASQKMVQLSCGHTFSKWNDVSK